MVMKPLSEIHLQSSIHLSDIHIGNASLRTDESTLIPDIVSLIGLSKIGPKADNENDLDVRAAAAMCQYAYHALNKGEKPKAELLDNWAPMDDFEVDQLMGPGFHQKLERKSSGFNSMLFQKQDNGIQYYAYCTEGTDMTSFKDWYSNISQGLTGLSPQHTYSVQIAKKLDQTIGESAVLWFIGHSLGGGLASNNSLATGRHAITFNAAGLHPYRVKATLLLNNYKDLFHYERRTSRIHAFVLKGEILNSVLFWIGQPAYGNRRTIDYHKKPGEKDKTASEKHGLTTILDSWRMKHD